MNHLARYIYFFIKKTLSTCITKVVRYDGSIFDGNMSLKDAVARIENSLYVDFAEHWQL
jgi:hypothetical protein